MDRHTFLLGFLGSLAAAPTIGAAVSSVEAVPHRRHCRQLLILYPGRYRRISAIRILS